MNEFMLITVFLWFILGCIVWGMAVHRAHKTVAKWEYADWQNDQSKRELRDAQFARDEAVKERKKQEEIRKEVSGYITAAVAAKGKAS